MWLFHCNTYVSKISIQNLYIAVHNFERDKLIILGTDATNKEQGGISSIDDLGVCFVCQLGQSRCDVSKINMPLYSRKLHILVRLPSTSCVTSLTILLFCFGAIVVNHFANLTLPIISTSILHSSQYLVARYEPCRETRRI